jgi:ABC-type ATPase involved in cell division
MPSRSLSPGRILAVITGGEQARRGAADRNGKEVQVDTNADPKVEQEAAAKGAAPASAEKAEKPDAGDAKKAAPATPTGLVSFEGVKYAYKKLEVLKGVTFSVQPGEIVFLVGPSGSGKTTLLRLAHGQLRPQAGKVVVDGRLLHRKRRRDILGLRRRVGVVFQDYKLLERLTAVENVAYALRVADIRLGRRDANQRAEEALREVGLGDKLKARISQLSYGQQQRVAIARALAARPAILLADEPTASLDEANAKIVLDLLERVAGKGTAVLVATQRHTTAEPNRRLLRLNDGRLGETPRPPESTTASNPDKSAPPADAAKPSEPLKPSQSLPENEW